MYIYYNLARREATSNKILSLNDIFIKISNRKSLFNPNDVRLEDDIK
jgi:hypothetical protein